MTTTVRHVDDLADPQIDGDACQQIGIDGRDAVLTAEPVDHPPYGVACRLVEIRPDAVGRVAPADQRLHVRGQELRAAEVQVLAHGQPDERAHRRLDGGAAHLAVALGGVAVAHRQPGTHMEYGQEQRRAGRQVTRVHVPAVEIGRDGRAWPVHGRHADLAAERRDRDADAGQELGALADTRHLRDPEVRIGELVRQEAEPGDAGRPAPVGRLELE